MSRASSLCPACAADNWGADQVVKDHSISGESFTLRECLSCNIKVTVDAPGPAEIAPYYASEDYISHSDVQKDLKDKLYHRARGVMLRRKAAWIQPHIPVDQGRLLDIGCGTGYFLQYMHQLGHAVVGLEPDDDARAIAAKQGDFPVYPSDHLAELDGSYDAITMWHVLEHVHDLDGYASKIRNLLAEDGLWVIAVPNHQSHDAKYYGTDWAAYDVPRHLWHFSPRSIDAYVQKHDMAVVDRKRMIMDPFYVSLLSSGYRRGKPSYLSAAWSGLRSSVRSFARVEESSSVVYFVKKK